MCTHASCVSVGVPPVQLEHPYMHRCIHTCTHFRACVYLRQSVSMPKCTSKCVCQFVDSKVCAYAQLEHVGHLTSGSLCTCTVAHAHLGMGGSAYPCTFPYVRTDECLLSVCMHVCMSAPSYMCIPEHFCAHVFACKHALMHNHLRSIPTEAGSCS